MAKRVRTVSYSLPESLIAKLEERADALGISKSSCVTMLLLSALSGAELDKLLFDDRRDE